MFPHTVTLYIQENHTDPATLHTVTERYITILPGVLIDTTLGADTARNGQVGADTAAVYIPFSVKAVDGITGAAKRYVSPSEFRQAEDKNQVWTLSPEGVCFFIKGEAVIPDLDRSQIEAQQDRVYSLTRVTERDFGGDMAHWEIGGA